MVLVAVLVGTFMAALCCPTRKFLFMRIFDMYRGNFFFRYASFGILPMLVVALACLGDSSNLDSMFASIFTIVGMLLAALFAFTQIPKYRQELINPETDLDDYKPKIGMLIQDIKPLNGAALYYYPFYFIHRLFVAALITLSTKS